MNKYPAFWSDLNVALSHDWLTGMRGGERVLEILCRGFPMAPILTLIHNSDAVSDTINDHPITTSWLQKVPAIFEYYRYFLPLFPHAADRLVAPKADLLISTSHCVAKGVKVQPGTKHLCYCFTPMRYVWSFYEEYFGSNPVKKLMMEPLLKNLKAWDQQTAAHVDRFVTLSHHVRQRIKKAYDREADVVYPPVDLDFFTPGEPKNERFDLIVSALVPYKRIDVAVRTYKRTGFPLRIVGVGTEMRALRKLAGGQTEFLGWLPDEKIRELYRRCRFLIFPGEEDFGIVPLEAQACGKPVIAFNRGGVLESVIQDVTGYFFPQQVEESLMLAVEEAADMKWDPAAIRTNAERFGVQQFIDGISRSIQKCLGK